MNEYVTYRIKKMPEGREVAVDVCETKESAKAFLLNLVNSDLHHFHQQMMLGNTVQDREEADFMFASLSLAHRKITQAELFPFRTYAAGYDYVLLECKV